MQIEKFTLGMGDCFARQGRAQLQAVIQAHATRPAVGPVWNKSNREHTIIHSEPGDVRAEADADHIVEEVIGLAESGGDGLRLAQEIYIGAHRRSDELTGP